MKIDKEIIKSIYPNHRKVTTKLINDLGEIISLCFFSLTLHRKPSNIIA
jgi:hypothetical protein